MSDLKKLKRELDSLRREFSNLSFYIDNVQPIPKDGHSLKNHQNARAVMKTIDYLLKTKFKEFERELVQEKKAKTHEIFMEKLGKTNSPTNNMMRQSSENIEVSRNFTQFVKKSVQRKKDGLPQQNIRTGSPQDERD